MENMWSPWRSQYIQSFHEKKDDKSCIFCNMENEDPDSKNNLLVFKSKYSFVVLNLYPYNNGHLMVVPYRHISNFSDLSDDELLDIMQLLKLSSKGLEEILHTEGFNIGLNMGKCAGAGIDQHIHFHIVPRWNGDTNFMPVLGEVKIISQDLLEIKIKLLEFFKKNK
ncbi:MAG TPA: HIT domain-containing protein [Ignavibacteriales bacterium]|nr:HIT domain-containing protein [Ignavibacteriales bacterium]HOL81207.1 HIT domain-containing protein [Ignavibacteriales bacterium]HOM65310.1 HIT domain-containing protein [Ignavibacteriales bacterium]HPD68102.1 HIT domain-containing protein [Ignavibacteriales bacterium]HPP33437.1 HIT domain-containing protein [Ignavibacteriales bacterium]